MLPAAQVAAIKRPRHPANARPHPHSGTQDTQHSAAQAPPVTASTEGGNAETGVTAVGASLVAGAGAAVTAGKVRAHPYKQAVEFAALSMAAEEASKEQGSCI